MALLDPSNPDLVAVRIRRIASRLRLWTVPRTMRRKKPLSDRVRARLTAIM
jgi:hypothetical protein